MAAQKDIENRVPITVAFTLGTMLIMIDSTIANVALPHMQGSVSASQDQIVWALTSYILGSALMTPLSGWAAMKFGRKRMALFSVISFTVASMACGVSTNLPELVAFRFVQGVAGASLMPLSQATLLDLFEPHLLPRVMSIWSSTVIVGPIVGPTLGGWLTEHFSWRWVFFINLPIGVLSAVGLYVFMEKDEGGRQRRFDFVGYGALVAFLGGFQMMLDRGPRSDWFESHEIWTWAAFAVSGLWVFAVQTATAKEPFFHRDLVKDANFVGSTLFGLLIGALLFSTNALLPTLMQTLLGYSALQSGIISAPRGIGSLLAFVFVPMFVTRLGPRPVLLVGVIGNAAALWIMATFDLSMDAGPLLVSGFLQGAAMGLLYAPLNVLGYATLDPSLRIEGTIVSNMLRSVGSSAGISIVQAMSTHIGGVAHSRFAERFDPANPLIRDLTPSVMDPATMTGALALNGEVTRQGSMIGYVDVFSWMALATLVMLPMVFMLRRPAPGARPVRAEITE